MVFAPQICQASFSCNDLCLESCSQFKENHENLLFHKKPVFAPQICHPVLAVIWAKNVIVKCHGVSNLMFEVRALEDLYPANCSQFKENL